MAEVIKEWDSFEVTAPPLNGAIPPRGVKRGRAVSAGELLARHPGPLLGDIHAPCSGLITEINEFEVIIQRDDEALGEPPQPRALHGLPPDELAVALKELGLDRPEVDPGDPLIINTLNPEPGLSYSAALFSEHQETMSAGLTAAARLWPGRRILWAASKKEAAPEGAETHIIAAPYSTPADLKRTITGRADPQAGGVLGGRELYFLGRLWRTGLPIIRMVISLGASSYFVPVGSRAADLLRFANLYPHGDEVVVRGGLMSGHSLARLERGLGKDASALHLVKGLRLSQPSRPELRHLSDGPFIKPSLWSRVLAFPRLFKKQNSAPAEPAPPGRAGLTARLKCGHGGQAPRLAEYHGLPNCRQADLHDQGPLVCPYGCLGYGDCAAVCPRRAIIMRDGFPSIEASLCIACGHCLSACPKNLFQLTPAKTKIFIACASQSGLKKNAEYCRRACLGCGRCRKACPAGAISRPAPSGAMAVDQDICQAHNETCGQPCRAACPRKIF